MKDTLRFLFELGQLKKTKRSGWWLAGIKDPETIAEHSFRSAIVARIIAEKEGADADKVTLMMLYHDVPESRINDLHKLGARYIDTDESENRCIKEQVENLPDYLKDEILGLFMEMKERKTKEAKVARDADLIECALQAKEYLDTGYPECQDWLDNISKVLLTGTGKAMLKEISRTKAHTWWHGLKNIDR